MVTILEVTIVLRMLLHCVIRQVYECVVYILEVNTEFCRRSSQISLLKEEELMVLIKQDPDSNVKFSLVYQERLLDILLNDECVVLDLIV